MRVLLLLFFLWVLRQGAILVLLLCCFYLANKPHFAHTWSLEMYKFHGSRAAASEPAQQVMPFTAGWRAVCAFKGNDHNNITASAMISQFFYWSGGGKSGWSDAPIVYFYAIRLQTLWFKSFWRRRRGLRSVCVFWSRSIDDLLQAERRSYLSVAVNDRVLSESAVAAAYGNK